MSRVIFLIQADHIFICRLSDITYLLYHNILRRPTLFPWEISLILVRSVWFGLIRVTIDRWDHFKSSWGVVFLPVRIRIMFVTRPSAGGIRKHLLSLVRRLTGLCYEVILVCPRDDSELRSLERQGVRVYPMAIRGELRPHRDLQATLKIKGLIERLNPDLIHAHSYKAGLLCLAAGGLKKHPPLICTFHNPVRREANKLQDLGKRRLLSALGRRATHVITVSQALRSEANTLLGIAEEKTTCIYNGIDLSEFSAPRQAKAICDTLGIGHYRYVVGTVCRLIPEKGLRCLIEAASILQGQLNGVCFAVVGDGPDRPFLEKLVQEKKMEKSFVFLGFRSDVPEILSCFDLFVLPSLEEALSIAILEAMAAKIPVISTAIGGIPEVVTAETGILLPPANPQILAASIRQLLLQPHYRLTLGRAGRERVERFFSLNQMIERHHELYSKILSRLGKR